MKQYFVYLMANKKNGTLYVGVTSDLVQRVHQHKEGDIEGFTKKYGIKTLVYYEIHEDVYAAITREKNIKRWKRLWKLRLIEEKNPGWQDLYHELLR